MIKTLVHYILIQRFFLIPLGLMLLTVQTQAQQKDSIANNYSTSVKNPNIIILQDHKIDGFNYWQKKFTGHWSGIYMGFNGFAHPDYSNYPEEDHGFIDAELLRSNSTNINILQASIGLQHNRNTIGLILGVGMEIQTYYLNQNTSIEKQFNRVEPIKLFFDDNQKSKLSITYLSLPLLVEFQIPVKQSGKLFYFTTGLIAKLRLNTHTKIKYRQDNQKLKLKTPDDFHMNDFTYAGTIRMGYGGINLFATYDLYPLFVDKKGPVIYPFSVGMALISF